MTTLWDESLGSLYESGLISTKTLFELYNKETYVIDFRLEAERLSNEIDTIFDDGKGRIGRGLRFLNYLCFN